MSLPGPVDLPGDHLSVHAVDPDRLAGCRSPPAGDQYVEIARTDHRRHHRIVIVGVRHLRPMSLVGRGEPTRPLHVADGMSTALHQELADITLGPAGLLLHSSPL